MSRDFIVDSYPCREVPPAVVANANFAVLSQSAMRGRIAVMEVNVDGNPSFIFDTQEKILDTVTQTVDGIMLDAQNAPSIEIKKPTEIVLQQAHKTAMNAIKFSV